MSGILSAKTVSEAVEVPWPQATEFFYWIDNIVNKDDYTWVGIHRDLIYFHNDEDLVMFKLKFGL